MGAIQWKEELNCAYVIAGEECVLLTGILHLTQQWYANNQVIQMAKEVHNTANCGEVYSQHSFDLSIVGLDEFQTGLKPTTNMVIDNVSCFGIEERLFDCKRRIFLSEDRACNQDGTARCREGGKLAIMSDPNTM